MDILNLGMVSKKGTMISKCFCMLFVLINHLCIEMSAPSQLRVCTHHLSHIGMEGFLLLSGYGLVISLRASGLDSFWDKKFLRVYFPAVLVNLLYASILVAYYGEAYNRGWLLAEVLMLNTSPQINWYLWYLRLLFVWYVIFFATAKLRLPSGKVRMVVWGVLPL